MTNIEIEEAKRCVALLAAAIFLAPAKVQWGKKSGDVLIDAEVFLDWLKKSD